MKPDFKPIDLSTLPQVLGKGFEAYEEGLMGRDPIDFCKYCRAEYDKKCTEFWPLCSGSVLESLTDDQLSDFPENDRALMRATADPVAWASINLHWDADWYQSQFLRCTSLSKVCRWGRRSGKTDALCVHALHKAMTRPGKKPYQQFTILVVTPYENQVNRIFGVLRNLIGRNPRIEEAVMENVKNPQLITFRNGSLIKGFTAGVKSGNKSEKIRGEDADEILLDESDLLTKDDLEAIIAIRGSHPRCGIIFSTTPSGKRETFYEVCTIKDKRFKEFWRVSHESPRYTSVTEELFHKMYSTVGYAREILAQFGELEEGVYQKKYVDAALQDYRYPDGPQPGLMYIMGVDWNDHTYGTHIVINEYSPETMQFRLVYKEVVQGGEYTQLKSIQRIIDLNHHWQPKHLALDAGYGTTSTEVLKMVGLRDPSSGLSRKLQAYNMSSKIVIRDPVSGIKTKKHIKPQMVDWTIRALEQGQQIFPVSEDDKASKGLVHQIRSYRRERISPDGRPVYSQGYDHTLTAWALTILIWNLEETEINVSGGVTRFTKIGGPEVDEDGDMYISTDHETSTPIQMTLRTHQANRGGLIPEKQTVRGQISRMRKRMRPSSRRTF